MRSLRRLLFAAVALATLASGAFAAELSGVKMPDKLTVAGEDLTLNGMGLRKVLIIKVYVAGLYVAAKSKDAGAILASSTPRAIRMELVRDVDKGRLTNGFKEGLEKNSAGQVASHQKQMDEFLACFGDQKKGAVILLADAAEGGLAVSIDGQVKKLIGDRAFANMVFAIWLGAKPPSDELRKGMLGG